MNTRIVAVLLALLLCAQSVPAQLDRTQRPGPGPAPAVSFPDYQVLKTKNGIRVIVVEDSELPMINMRLQIDRKPVAEGKSVGFISIAGEMLRQGTAHRTKDQLDEEVDLLGGSLSSSGTSVWASGLSKHVDKLMGLMADIVLHPSFPQSELDKLVMQRTSGLKYRKTDPDMVVDLVRKKVVFGPNHPYGEIETEESVSSITREKCIQAYTTFFKPNYAIVAVVGDIKKQDALRLVERYFGSWKKGTITSPKYSKPRMLDKTQIALVDRPASVQSVIRLAQVVDLQRTSPDVMPVMTMNTILGGSSAFRLFMNLREKHAFTYGAYSWTGPDDLIGNFSAWTSVRNIVTDSAITEVMSEIRRIRTDTVEPKELEMAKSFRSGEFVRSLEQAGTVADRAIEIERYKLPKDYYKTYLKRLDAVTAQDVRRVAQTYLHPDKMLVAVVGSAKDVKEKLAVFGPVTMYDEEGNRIVETAGAAATMDVDAVLGRAMGAIGGKARWDALKDMTVEMTGTMMAYRVKAKTVRKAPGKLYQEMSIVGMFQQKTGFDGQTGWAVTPQGVIELKGEQLRGVLDEAQINFYDRYKDLGYTASVTGTKDIKGAPCYELTFIDTSGGQKRHYLSAASFLLAREVNYIKTSQGSIEQATDYTEYKDYDGYLLPSKLEQSVMGQTMALAIDSVRINSGGVDDALFAKPVVK